MHLQRRGRRRPILPEFIRLRNRHGSNRAKCPLPDCTGRIIEIIADSIEVGDREYGAFQGKRNLIRYIRKEYTAQEIGIMCFVTRARL